MKVKLPPHSLSFWLALAALLLLLISAAILAFALVPVDTLRQQVTLAPTLFVPPLVIP